MVVSKCHLKKINRNEARKAFLAGLEIILTPSLVSPESEVAKVISIEKITNDLGFKGKALFDNVTDKESRYLLNPTNGLLMHFYLRA